MCRVIAGLGRFVLRKWMQGYKDAGDHAAWSIVEQVSIPWILVQTFSVILMPSLSSNRSLASKKRSKGEATEKNQAFLFLGSTHPLIHSCMHYRLSPHHNSSFSTQLAISWSQQPAAVTTDGQPTNQRIMRTSRSIRTLKTERQPLCNKKPVYHLLLVLQNAPEVGDKAEILGIHACKTTPKLG